MNIAESPFFWTLLLLFFPQTTQQIIEDHELFIDDLNSTGLELMELCAEADAVDLQNRLLDTNKRYEDLKSTARGKARDLMNAKRKFTQEVGLAFSLIN